MASSAYSRPSPWETYRRCHLVGEIADGDPSDPIVAEIGGVDAHGACARPHSCRRRCPWRPSHLAERAVSLVRGKPGWEPCHWPRRDSIQRPRRSHRLSNAKRLRERHSRRSVVHLHTRRGGHVREAASPLPSLTMQRGNVPSKVRGGAVGAADTGEPEVLREIDGARPAHIVADEQVEVAVIVGVHPAAATCSSIGRAADPSLDGHILKRPPTLGSGFDPTAVTKTSTQPSCRSRRRRHPCRRVTCEIRSRHCSTNRARPLLRYSEIEGRTAAGRRIADQGQGSAIDEEQVLITVVVDIEERDAAPHRFRQQLLAVGAAHAREVIPASLVISVNQALMAP